MPWGARREGGRQETLQAARRHSDGLHVAQQARPGARTAWSSQPPRRPGEEIVAARDAELRSAAHARGPGLTVVAVASGSSPRGRSYRPARVAGRHDVTLQCASRSWTRLRCAHKVARSDHTPTWAGWTCPHELQSETRSAAEATSVLVRRLGMACAATATERKRSGTRLNSAIVCAHRLHSRSPAILFELRCVGPLPHIAASKLHASLCNGVRVLGCWSRET